jgi:hypothetical protein
MRYTTGSNPAYKTMLASRYWFNGDPDSVLVSFWRNDTFMEHKVARYSFEEFNLKRLDRKKWKITEDSIGIVNLGLIERQDVDSLMEEMKHTKAIIFDGRQYPKGTYHTLAWHLNSRNKPFAKFTIPDLKYPGKYKWTKPYTSGRRNRKAYPGKVIVLINEYTMSHGEFSVMSLQTAPDVTIVGRNTAGADGNISRFNMFGTSNTSISGIGIFYPDGRETQRIGIVPDIYVERKLEHIENREDGIMLRAIDFIETGK